MLNYSTEIAIFKLFIIQYRRNIKSHNFNFKSNDHIVNASLIIGLLYHKVYHIFPRKSILFLNNLNFPEITQNARCIQKNPRAPKDTEM